MIYCEDFSILMYTKVAIYDLIDYFLYPQWLKEFVEADRSAAIFIKAVEQFVYLRPLHRYSEITQSACQLLAVKTATSVCVDDAECSASINKLLRQ